MKKKTRRKQCAPSESRAANQHIKCSNEDTAKGIVSSMTEEDAGIITQRIFNAPRLKQSSLLGLGNEVTFGDFLLIIVSIITASLMIPTLILMLGKLVIETM